MKNKKFIVITAILAFLAICCVIFIFSNSLKDSAESTDQTMVVKDILARIAKFFGIKGDIDTSGLRSFAHVAEFGLLGACIAAISLCAAYKKGKFTLGELLPFIIFALVGGVLIAIADEILQLSSEGRACELKDVGLDAVGVVIGTFFSCAVAFVGGKIHNARKLKENDK